MSSRTEDHTDVLKQALHDNLDGLQVLGSSVPHYEHVPTNEQMPYFVNGRINQTPRPYAPGGGYRGSQNFQTQIDCFSDYNGDKEVDALRNAVQGVLMGTLTVPSGFKVTDRELLNNFTQYLEDEEVRQGVVEVRLAIQIL